MTTEKIKCELCGEPMPEGEQMFKYHGYSGPCPKPTKEKAKPASESVSDDAEQARYWRTFRESVGPLCRAIVTARTPEEEREACKALAKWMNDDLDVALAV